MTSPRIGAALLVATWAATGPAFARGSDQASPAPAAVSSPPSLELQTKACTPANATPATPRGPYAIPDAKEKVPACEFAVSSAANATRWILRVRSLGPGGLLSIALDGYAPGWLPWTNASTTTDSKVDIESDSAVADQEVLLPSGFAGKARVARLDLGDAALPFEISLVAAAPNPDVKKKGQAVSPLADFGQTLRIAVPALGYSELVKMARGAALRATQDPAIKRQLLDMAGKIIGRGPLEISPTKSEPIVVFVGVAGSNEIILSDDIAWPMPARHDDSGKRYTEPWQTTFERADYFWALYVEEERAPFNTSIDVEFQRRASPDEHDDFDPQGVARRDTTTAGADLVRVRVGFKRFRIPDTFDVVQVTFSRQSASYGLRQWSKTFTRYGKYPVRLAGAAVAVLPTVERRDFTVVPVYADDEIDPGAYGVEVERRKQPLFAAVGIRLPQLRESQEQAPFNMARYWRAMVPEPMLGIGVPTVNGKGFSGQSLLVAGSWPVVGDRVHFMFGFVRVKEPHALPGYGTPMRLPAPLPLDEIREMKARWKPLLGISVDLVRTW